MKKIKLRNASLMIQLEHFKQELKSNDPTSDSYIEHVAHIKELFFFIESQGLFHIKQIDQQIANDFITYLENRPNQRRDGLLHNTTINKFITSINTFTKYLHEERIKIPSIKLRYRKKEDRKVPTVLTKQEIKQLYEVIDDTPIGLRDKCMLAIYLGCGLRRSEGVNLKITDIDLMRGRIHIKKTKNRRERYVMLSPKVVEQIEAYIYYSRDLYLSEYNPCEELFISERGRPVDGGTMAKRIETLWQRVIETYGSNKHITLHSLRHTLGTQLYQSGMKLNKIALMLGHRTLEATELYVTLSNLNS